MTVVSNQHIDDLGFSSVEDLNERLQSLSHEKNKCLERKDWQGAERAIKTVLSLVPNHADALAELVFVVLQQGDAEQAYLHFQSALSGLDDYRSASIDILVHGALITYAVERHAEALVYSRCALEKKHDRALDGAIKMRPITSSMKKVLSDDPTRNIISFSLFGGLSRYCEVAVINASLAKRIYPEWTCRFYVDNSVPRDVVERIIAADAQVVVMDGGQSDYRRLLWRFEVMSDPSVDCFLIRDADSLLSFKERAAVDEWLDSGCCFHLMRDSIEHCELVLAGMWGGYTGVFDNVTTLIDEYLSQHNQMPFNIDQKFLREVCYPTIQQSVMVHDNYNLDGRSLPFPHYKLSDVEKVPKFRIGWIDVYSRPVSVAVPQTDATTIMWHLFDEHDQQVCQYEQPLQRNATDVVLPLPSLYAERVLSGLWWVSVQPV